MGLPGESRGQLRAPDRVVRPLAGHDVDRPGDLGDRAADGLRLLARSPTAAGSCSPRSCARCSTPQGREVQGFEPKVVRQVISPADRAHAHRDDDRRRRQRHRPQRGHRRLRGRRQDRHRAEDGPGDPPLLAGARRALVRGRGAADDPRLAMLVMLDEPKNEKWGSEAAAPIFAAIGREALRHLNVPRAGRTPVQIVRGESGPVSDTPPRRRPPSGGRRSARPSPRASAVDGRRRRGRGADARARRALAPPGPRGPGPAGRAGRDRGPRHRDRRSRRRPGPRSRPARSAGSRWPRR